MNIYLAARYSRREELLRYKADLEYLGHTVTARWLDGNHQLSDDGVPIGDSGMALTDDGTLASELRSKFAQEDFDDVTNADIVISFTEAPRSKPNRGGRHVEFGIALALGARCLVVGHRENIFHWLQEVEFHADWTSVIKAMNDCRPDR